MRRFGARFARLEKPRLLKDGVRSFCGLQADGRRQTTEESVWSRLSESN
jgi:hypothetical protein